MSAVLAGLNARQPFGDSIARGDNFSNIPLKRSKSASSNTSDTTRPTVFRNEAAGGSRIGSFVPYGVTVVGNVPSADEDRIKSQGVHSKTSLANPADPALGEENLGQPIATLVVGTRPGPNVPEEECSSDGRRLPGDYPSLKEGTHSSTAGPVVGTKDPAATEGESRAGTFIPIVGTLGGSRTQDNSAISYGPAKNLEDTHSSGASTSAAGDRPKASFGDEPRSSGLGGDKFNGTNNDTDSPSTHSVFVDRQNSKKRMAEGEGHGFVQDKDEVVSFDDTHQLPSKGKQNENSPYPEQRHAGKLDGPGPEYGVQHRAVSLMFR